MLLVTPIAGVSGWWIAGWAVGFGGAVVAALLLVSIVGLGRRITAQAEDVGAAIEHAHASTSQMFELGRTNLALDRIGRALRTLDGGEGR